MIKLLLISTISIIIPLSSAHAYLDPGTGSIILQAIIGLIAAAATFLKIYWDKFLKLLGIKKEIIIDQKKKKKEK